MRERLKRYLTIGGEILEGLKEVTDFYIAPITLAGRLRADGHLKETGYIFIPSVVSVLCVGLATHDPGLAVVAGVSIHATEGAGIKLANVLHRTIHEVISGSFR